MATLNISLPADLKRVVDQRVKAGKFASSSEYLRSLIREDQKNLDQERLEDLLLKRLQSGRAVEMTDADFDAIRQRLEASIQRKSAARRRRKTA